MKYFFYLLSSIFFSCTTLVLGVNNPIHSILLLILVFFTGSIFLFSLNLEFFAIVFLVVYVGAIVVLFLFIIMMLDIKIINTGQKFKDFFSYKNIIIALILIELLYFLNEDHIMLDETLFSLDDNTLNGFTYHNTDFYKTIWFSSHIQTIGKVLFCEYKKSFLISGLVLFIAMIGAIVITVEDVLFKKVKQQNAVSQTLRNSKNSIFNFKLYKKG